MEKSILTSTFLRLRNRLRSMATGITGSSDDAEDALNEAFCRLWSKYPALENEEEAARISYTVVRNVALDRREYILSHSAESMESLSGLSVPNYGEEEDNEKRELYDSLLAMAARVLKEAQYRVFILHDVEGVSYPEIARQLEMTQVNVRQLLSRARKSIREEYKKLNS